MKLLVLLQFQNLSSNIHFFLNLKKIQYPHSCLDDNQTEDHLKSSSKSSSSSGPAEQPMDYLVYSLNSSRSSSSSSSSRIIADGLAVDESVIITSGSASGSESIARGATVEIGRGGVVDDPGGILAAANSCFSANLSSSTSAGEVFQQQQQHADYLNELFREKFNDATVIVSVVVLVLINFVVIAGNILVILSVFTSAKLRTVTNFFIGKWGNFLLA